MESQFARVECYGRRPSKRKADGRSMEGVAYEAERKKHYCDHVAKPRKPTVLLGCSPSAAVRIAEERAEQAVVANGRRLRADAVVFLGGVASYPVPWTTINGNKAEADRLRRWLACLLQHLQAQYGVTLHYALLHADEPYPHVHWGVVPELEPGEDGERLRISTVHPGRAAYERARMTGGDNNAGRRAYLQAMVKWQDDFHLAVYAPVGIARLGSKRQRLTLSERKARQKAEAALARTLEAEQAIKTKWRGEIRAEVEQSFSDSLMCWETMCRTLQAQLQTAKRDLADREVAIAELQREIEDLRPPSPGPTR